MASSSSAIDGTVLDGLGQPAPGVKVLLDDTVVTTDAAGRFSVAAAGQAYDLALSASADLAFVYQGMTTRTPIVRLDGTYLSPDESEATVLLEASGLDPAEWLGAAPSVLPGQPESSINFGTTSWRVRWAGHDPIRVGFYASTHELVDGQLGHSTGVLTAPPVLVHPNETRTFAVAPSSLMRSEESSVRAEVHLPPAYHVTQAVLWEGTASDGCPIAPFDVMTQSSELSFFVPDAASRRGLTIEATSGDATTDVYVDLPAAGTTVVEVPAAPSALSPDDGASDVGGVTELRWTPVAGGTNFAVVYDGSGGSAPTIRIAAADGVARVPDLTPIGVALPPHAWVAWAAFSASPARSVDDFARSGAATSPANPNVTTHGAPLAFLTR